MMQSYTSNGKFLLTGEYLVLHGALALALPLQLGQSMTVDTPETDHDRVVWNADRPDGPWFHATMRRTTLEVVDTDDQGKADKIAAILKALREMNPRRFDHDLDFHTHLGFNPEWGLGSSSTLISNLARWGEVNPYTLLKNTFGGSGYDIACATATTPIFYHVELDNPVSQPARFAPPFAQQLFFVYLGKKQHSSKEVTGFSERWRQFDFQGDIEAVSEISRSLPDVKSLGDFRSFLDIHEDILAHCLGREPVHTLFPDFEGSLKSLGAWGGDFILAATPWDGTQVRDYFHQKGLDVIFNYNDIVYNHDI
ncbi:MAG: hypothetical protein K6A28_04290 [Bacteroidales bacterium]|nr:hypothetical protein [Bacteroidales bacterium]